MVLLLKVTSALISLSSNMQLPVHTERNIDVSQQMNPKSYQPAPTSVSGEELNKMSAFSQEKLHPGIPAVSSPEVKKNQQSKLSKWMWKKKIIFFYLVFIYCLQMYFEDVSSRVIAVKTVTENTLQCRRGEADQLLLRRQSFKVKRCDSFVFSFYSETI